ncbi:ATP-binding protein [Streptomyces panaciradicis]|uniref:ATP-binding protein n=1 Tax=Streptomyces panaciradicis TaxID=1470261 RepID=UPI00201CFAF9|nr:LuxR family transcriptional regulator [Streptomyces panaciradicis]MCL6670116.1 AAA family ATPase [Streptomyces panaciradicis]
MAAGDDAERATGIVGREAELTCLREFLSAAHPDAHPTTLVVQGEAGSGKSTLLNVAARQASGRGVRVLRCAGHQGERDLAFAGLHQLLEPVRDGVHALPPAQRRALLAVFGCGEGEPWAGQDLPGRLLINLAVLTLLSEAAAEQPLLLVADDAQWLDACSLDALAFVARRVSGEPVHLLMGVRGEAVPRQFGADFVLLPVPPLDGEAAERLLDAQPRSPHGRLREHVLRQAVGNPLALVELARATAGAAYPLASAGPAETLPLTARLEDMFAERLAGLPTQTRRVLLFAAAADAPDMPAALLAAAASASADVETWSVAEEAGLIRLESGRVVFRHPLMRSAIYGSASFAARREVHLSLAQMLDGDPDRRAWHLAAATLVPDESIAAALEETAGRARRRGGYRVAAAALERAAELSPEGTQRARRLLEAIELAMNAGEPLWVEQLAAGVVSATDDEAMLMTARLWTGWALAATTRQKAALSHLLPLAEEVVKAAPVKALTAVGHAAFVVYTTGEEDDRRQMLDLLARIPVDAGRDFDQVWTRACCDPFAARETSLELLRRCLADPDRKVDQLTIMGGAAWVLDETATAVRLLGAAMEHLQSATTVGSNATLGQALALAQFETGAWEAAWASAEDARRVAAENGLEMAGRAAMFVAAALLALRGRSDEARKAIDRAVEGVDPAESRALGVRASWVRAAVAGAEGNHALEYELLRSLFSVGPDPQPVHYHASYYAIGDLAAAAVRVGKQQDAAQVLDAVWRRLEGHMSPRMLLLVRRAGAVLAEDDSTEELFAAALRDPAGEQWPFERAVVLLEYGEWLRRRRRTTEARTELAGALTVFEQLGARPWVERTSAELRACGVSVHGDGGASRGIDRLTPQQLQIARLAATGLTNRQIGERLLLSARTIGFHLYQTYPKLGITNRAQLRDALSGMGA